MSGDIATQNSNLEILF